MKFAKYSWGINPETGKESYAIVQVLDKNSPEVIRMMKGIGWNLMDSESFPDKGMSLWGKLIYGSKREYESSGKVFHFNDVKEVIELDTEEVLENYFVGLL